MPLKLLLEHGDSIVPTYWTQSDEDRHEHVKVPGRIKEKTWRALARSTLLHMIFIRIYVEWITFILQPSE